MSSILIIDDNISLLNSLRILLKAEFDQVETANHPDKLLSSISRADFDIILLDMNFKAGQTEGNEGLYWLSNFKKSNPDAVVIMMTAYGDVELAIEAIKRGAFDFIQKPWKTEKLIASLKAGLQLRKSRLELNQLKKKNQSRNQDLNQVSDQFIGDSPQIKKVFSTINKIAATEATVLISGENGTGKELIAREIHNKSTRNLGPFVEVDMGALNENLFESELFGHKKNSFTGAENDRIGRFEYAAGGTLFLDEIGNLSLNMQSKLLRVIQNQSFQLVGSNEPVYTDVRLIFASNLNLQEQVENGEFREDLFFRINTIEIEAPALRNRPEDIPLLSRYFLRKFANRYNKKIIGFEQETIKQLVEYSWPGNVRELRHSVERAVIMAEQGKLRPQDFLFRPISASKTYPVSLNLEEVEKWTIENAIDKYPNNLSKAAQILNISRTTLYSKIKKYGL